MGPQTMLPAPGLSLSPQPSRSTPGGIRIEGTRQEHILGTCGKKTFCSKERERAEGPERSKGKGGQKRRGGEPEEEERRGGRCSPCSPKPAQQPLFPDMSTLSWGLGAQRTRQPRGRQAPLKEPLKSLLLPWTMFRSCWGWDRAVPRSRLSWGAPLGAQGEGGRDGSGGGQGQESRRQPPTGSGCGSGSRTTGRLQPCQSLKLLPAWLRAHEGQAVWSQRQRVGEEGFWQPLPTQGQGESGHRDTELLLGAPWWA